MIPISDSPPSLGDADLFLAKAVDTTGIFVPDGIRRHEMALSGAVMRCRREVLKPTGEILILPYNFH